MSGDTLASRANTWTVGDSRAITSYNFRSHSAAIMLAMWRIHKPAYVRAWENYVASMAEHQRIARQEWARLVL
jgi:hypothetical protein